MLNKDFKEFIELLNFKECYQSKVEVTIEEIRANFIDIENLKKQACYWSFSGFG